MTDLKLSENFNLSEFRCRCGCEISTIVQIQLRLLVDHVLQPLRDVVGPIRINSGYRCETYNRRVGGAKHSQHIFGTAADITVRGLSPKCVQALLDGFMRRKGYGGVGSYDSFTHVDIRSKEARW